MNSRELETRDELGRQIRGILRQSVARARPALPWRARLLARAAEQRRHQRWLARQLFARSVAKPLLDNWQNVAWNHFAYFNLLCNFGLTTALYHQLR
jgi:hypothetical protein